MLYKFIVSELVAVKRGGSVIFASCGVVSIPLLFICKGLWVNNEKVNVCN